MVEKLMLLAGCIGLLLFIQQLVEQKRRIILWGDSITEQGVRESGFINELFTLLGKKWHQRNKLIVQGKGGRTIQGIAENLPAIIASKPKAVIVFIGTNDVWHQQYGKGTAPEVFLETYSQVVNELLSHGIRIGLVTIAAIGEPNFHPELYKQFEQRIQLYNSLIQQIGTEYRVAVLPAHQAFEQHWLAFPHQPLTTDGVHLNPQGNQLLAKLYLSFIQSVSATQ